MNWPDIRFPVFAALLALALPSGTALAQAPSSPSPDLDMTPHNRTWFDNKYSMFIHFGLYSSLGGVWQGKEIHTGYSEQIQAHAGIYSNVYQDLASDFDPINFNAEEIVRLAKAAGMRSIVITSKHHDGFCMFRTSTTDFNSFDATPSHRDYIRELSDACHKGGIRFGLYYSLIDWNYPGASNFMTHNANFIPQVHHQLNMAQVEELVTGYGEISELWFDMGSLRPEQSRQLYDLVRRHQPDCMISGRLGNGCYDFAVMSDNYYPESSLQIAWQSCASMFNETWGYRSWQKRGSVHEKAQEKLRSLLRVVAGGGNFLLNIGPMGDGSVVPFEREVLEEMGAWLRVNSDAVYQTEGSPYRRPFDWGGITRKDNSMFLILSGSCPKDRTIRLSVPGCRLVSCQGPAKARLAGKTLTVSLQDEAYSDEIKVIRLVFDRPVPVEESTLMDTRMANSSYFCQDYHTNHRSEVSYLWNVSSTHNLGKAFFTFSASDIGKSILMDVDGSPYHFRLEGEAVPIKAPGTVSDGGRYVCLTGTGGFDGPLSRIFSLDQIPDNDQTGFWKETADEHQSFSCKPFQTLYVMETVLSDGEGEAIMEVGGGNGVELYVNGKSVMKHLNPYRCQYRTEKVRVQLHKGENQVVLRSFNRFEKRMEWLLKVSEDQTLYRCPLPVSVGKGQESHKVTIRQAGTESRHQDCELYNLQMSFM